MDLGTMMDSVSGYEKLWTMFEFKADGTGSEAWSHRVVNSAGDAVEFRATNWTHIAVDGEVTGGSTHKDLKKFLLSQCTREELLDFLTA